jgi:hypothetical protein
MINDPKDQGFLKQRQTLPDNGLPEKNRGRNATTRQVVLP